MTHDDNTAATFLAAAFGQGEPSHDGGQEGMRGRLAKAGRGLAKGSTAAFPKSFSRRDHGSQRLNGISAMVANVAVFLAIPRNLGASGGRAGLVLGGALFLIAAPLAAQTPLRVRGAAALEAAATPLEGKVELRGLVKDDTGRGIGNAHVRLELRSGENGPPLRLPNAQTCPPSPMTHEARGFPDAADEYVIDTDAAGAFCVRISDVGPPGVLRLRFEDSGGLFDGVERFIPLENLRRTLDLSFTPVPSLLPLERNTQTVSLETRLRPTVNGEPAIPIRMTLRLSASGSAPIELAHTEISAGERADFLVPSKELAPPGPATLIASFPGSSTVQPAETRVVVMRTAQVHMEVPHSPPAATSGETVSLRVAVKTPTGGSPTGTIEARLGRATVGIAGIRQGAADLLVAFEAQPGQTAAELELRYLPDAPWWVAGPPQRIRLPLRPPSPWRRVPWLIAAITLGLWVIASWRRPVRTERPATDKPAPRLARAAIRLVKPGDEGSGYAGRIIDAHDGAAIAEATIVIRRRVFQGDGVVASTTSDAEGTFALGALADSGEEGALIEVAARWHSKFSAPLPAPGVLMLELISRRRTLLQRLVDWAGQRGEPWVSAGEPTPGHVARTAERERTAEVAGWARATEEAAYGPNPPDDVAEELVRNREPRIDGPKLGRGPQQQ